MEWNKLLGLSASLLAGGAAWFPKTAPWSWGNRTSLENQKYGILGRRTSPTGWRANPVCAMQEPNPD